MSADSAYQPAGSNQPSTTPEDEYVSRPSQKATIPVQSDTAAVETGGYDDAAQADSDQQLQQDDSDAIDQSNIIDDRTRGAAKDSYAEPGDEEGLGGAN